MRSESAYFRLDIPDERYNIYYHKIKKVATDTKNVSVHYCFKNLKGVKILGDFFPPS
jgi:hypothetical protein